MDFGPNWAGGFFADEGSTWLRTDSNDNKTIIVFIGQKDIEVLEIFKESVGGLGGISGPHSDMYKYTVSGEKAKLVLDLMWPYIGRLKQEQAKIAIERWLEYKETVPKAKHGTRYMYSEKGCRCEECLSLRKREHKHYKYKKDIELLKGLGYTLPEGIE